MIAIREARPSDNAALVELAALCPMQGDMSLCVHREPDFFALSRLAGDDWRVGVAEGPDGRPIACAGVARREVYIDGAPTRIAYIGDMKVHPAHRRQGLARALGRWAREAAADLAGEDGLGVSTTLAGNTAVHNLLWSFAADGVRATPHAVIRSHSIPLLWRRRLPATDLLVRQAGPDDLPEMTALWKRVAPARQLAPAGIEPWIGAAPGLTIFDYLIALRPDGTPVGFLGLWDQHAFKQMRVTGYSARMAVVRALFNAAAPLAGAPRLPAAGGELRYRTVVHPCAEDHETLRALLLHACHQLRGHGYSFLTIGLDVADPLARAVRGLGAQPTDVTALVGPIATDPYRRLLGDGPVHFEIATV
ncbi:GNAT family N-acetyltransferase [Streptosporangiaceae bacterium NEAU-GS5]|nr:GNAT family N-acetyltransferase [Streptosporangiaceae bacterium NEAU-GS5]